MKSRFAKRTDGNQLPIVNRLRDRGYQIVITNMGENFPDLLVGFCGKWTLLEVKQADGGKLSRGQLQFLSDASGPVAIVRNEDEAVDAICGQALTQDEQDRIAVWLRQNPDQDKIRVKKLLGIIGRTTLSEQQNGRRGTDGKPS